jgi:acetyl-CoA carboxylase carboxyl transferase beta subunit/acetyl-CoA carboxylase carboxyl transferase alpha subunit
VSVESEVAPAWLKCPGCGRLLYRKRLVRDTGICRECGHHFRMCARERIATLADAGSFAELDADISPWDPLGFTDLRPYSDRLAEAARQSGEAEAVVYGAAEIHGHPVVIAVMEFAFMGGSMGTRTGEKITRSAELALESRIPLVIVCASGGARMQEGILSLLQMARTAQAMGRLHEAGVLTVCVLTDPTFGGVTASFAMLGGVVLAEPGALVGFAGPRVIAQTIRQELPSGFQTSEFLLQHGLIDGVVPRAELKPLLGRLLHMHAPGAMRGLPSGRPAADYAEPPPSIRDPWEVVRLARELARPTTLDYLREGFDDFVELHGDRANGDDPAIVAGVAMLGGRSLVVIGHQKGHTTKQLVARNFGMPHPEGYRKALRMLDYAERYGMPVLTLIDTAGAFPGIEAEQRGQSNAIAEIIMRSSQLRVPLVSVVTGEGGSGGALALATGDLLLMLENSFYSVISPEGCAAILWRTASAAPDAARSMHLTADDLRQMGVADAVVPEPPGGAHADPGAAAAILREAVLTALCGLLNSGHDPAARIAQRYQRFRREHAAPVPVAVADGQPS